MHLMTRSMLATLLVVSPCTAAPKADPAVVSQSLSGLETSYTARAKAASAPIWREYLSRLDAMQAGYGRAGDIDAQVLVIRDMNKIRETLGLEPLPEPTPPAAAEPVTATPATTTPAPSRSPLDDNGADSGTKSSSNRVKPDAEGAFTLLPAEGRSRGPCKLIDGVLRAKPGISGIIWRLAGAKATSYAVSLEYAAEGADSWVTSGPGLNYFNQQWYTLSSTGGAGNFKTASGTVTLTAGNQDLVFGFDGNRTQPSTVYLRKVTLTPTR